VCGAGQCTAPTMLHATRPRARWDVCAKLVLPSTVVRVLRPLAADALAATAVPHGGSNATTARCNAISACKAGFKV